MMEIELPEMFLTLVLRMKLQLPLSIDTYKLQRPASNVSRSLFVGGGGGVHSI